MTSVTALLADGDYDAVHITTCRAARRPGDSDPLFSRQLTARHFLCCGQPLHAPLPLSRSDRSRLLVLREIRFSNLGRSGGLSGVCVTSANNPYGAKISLDSDHLPAERARIDSTGSHSDYIVGCGLPWPSRCKLPLCYDFSTPSGAKQKPVLDRAGILAIGRCKPRLMEVGTHGGRARYRCGSAAQ